MLSAEHRSRPAALFDDTATTPLPRITGARPAVLPSAARRLVRFGAVGLTGLVVNLAVLGALLALDIPGVTEPFLAACAAQVAIVWNFVLTERWALTGRGKRGTWAHRLVAYAATSNVALLVQLPLAGALVAATDIGYLLATACAIGTLTVLRFALLDRLVYRARTAASRLPTRLLVAGALVAAGVCAWVLGPAALVAAAVVVLVALLFFVATSSLALSLHAWYDPQTAHGVGFSPLRPPRHGISVIVPVRNEIEKVLGATVNALATQDHPDFEVLIVVSGDDDEDTRDAAGRIARRHPRHVRVVQVHGPVKNKPLALMAALPHCRKDLVTIFDAESVAAPGVLRHIDSEFEATGADVVQCGVQLMNYDDSWYALQNCLEYYLWFKSRLHWQANQRFATYGGNSITLRRRALEDVGGWDTENLTEDAELGVRMSARGYRLTVAYDPRLVTREETPDSIRGLLLQRRRWMQGFIQTYCKGEWRKLPRKQRGLALYSLVMPSVQAVTAVIMPLSAAVAVLVKLPTILAMATFLPLAPAVASIAASVVALHDFGRDFGLRIRLRHYLVLIVGTVPYQLVLSTAAVLALVRHVQKRTAWDVTKHSGAHLDEHDLVGVAA